MRNEAKERKSYDYRWCDLIPYVGAATFYYRLFLGEIKGEISDLKENANSLFNTVTITTYQVVSIDLINKLIYGESILEKLIKYL